MSIAEIGEKLGCSQYTIARCMKKLNIPRRNLSESILLSFKTGRNHKARLGRKTLSSGYIAVYARDNERAFKKDGYICEHRLIWEKANGSIPEGWHVHHINGVKTDNRLRNLIALPNGEHIRKHGLLQKAMKKRICELEALLTKYEPLMNW